MSRLATQTARLALVLACGTTALVAGCREDAPTAPTTPTLTSAVEQQLVARETRKWDLVFGSAPQRDTVLSWYASDFVNVGDGPTGVTRNSKSEVAGGLAMFPQLPAGTFRVTGMQAIHASDNTLVLSYRVTGPGPTGAPWSAYAASVWAYRDGAWRTVFYQASPTAP